MNNKRICVLPEGRSVRYSLQQQDGFYHVHFRMRNGKRTHRSTQESNLKRAEKQAVKLIIAEYSPKVTRTIITWADAEDMMTVKMKEANRRRRTIQDYLLTLKVLKDLFSETNGPTDITLIHAEEFKGRRLKEKIEPITVGEGLDTLSSIWKKWCVCLAPSCRMPRKSR